MMGESISLHELRSDWDHEGSFNELRRCARRPSEQIFDEVDHTGETSQFSQQLHCRCPPCKKDSTSHGSMTIFIYSFMDIYINQINITPFYLKNNIKSRFITIKRIGCHLGNDISLEEGLSTLAENLPKWRELNGR